MSAVIAGAVLLLAGVATPVDAAGDVPYPYIYVTHPDGDRYIVDAGAHSGEAGTYSFEAFVVDDDTSDSMIEVRWKFEYEDWTPWTTLKTTLRTYEWGSDYAKRVSVQVRDPQGNTGSNYVDMYISSVPSKPTDAEGGCRIEGAWFSWQYPYYDGGAAADWWKGGFYRYQVQVADPDGRLVVSETFEGDDRSSEGSPWYEHYDFSPAWDTGDYTFRVRHSNALGYSEWSDPVSHKLCDLGKPSAPKNLRSTSHPDSERFYASKEISLAWDAATDGYSGIKGYAISGVGTSDIDTTGLQYTYTDDRGFDTWQTVTAVDNVGNRASAGVPVKYDVVPPTIDHQSHGPGAVFKSGGLQEEGDTFRVEYSDRDGGADPNQLTGVDASSVRLFIDGAYSSGDQEATADWVEYTGTRLNSPGSHTIRLEIKDDAIGSEYAKTTWTILVEGPDPVYCTPLTSVLTPCGGEPVGDGGWDPIKVGANPKP